MKTLIRHVTIGKDHRLVLDLPPETADQAAKVVVEIQSENSSRTFDRPTQKRRLSGKYQGLVTIPDSFLEPLSEDELRLWYGDTI